MRVLLVTAAFPPEPIVTARTSWDVADELANRGHLVRVIAPFPSRPPGVKYSGFDRRLTGRTERLTSGVEVIRCWSVFSRSSTLLSRLIENASFGLTAAIAMLLARRFDAIYSNTWPLFATGLVAVVSRMRNIPLVLTVQDLYPESLCLQGRLAEGSVPIRLLLRLDRWIARAATFLLLLGESSAREYVKNRSIYSKRCLVVPNWTNLELASSPQAAARFREGMAIPKETFLLVYCGNVGAAAGVERLIGALVSLPDDSDAGLLVAGEGSRLSECERLTRKLPPGRVWFHHPFPDSETSAVLGAANVCVVPTSGDQSAASVPSKLMAYMLAGKPVIAVALGNSDMATVMHASRCGWLVPPNSEQEFMRTLAMVRALPVEELQARGEAGRAYALEHFTRTAGAPRVADAIESAGRGAGH